MTRVFDALRVLLGAVMVITALRYFMPPLLPFLPAVQWDDPMAARLMASYNQSGLLAVAKFIHLATGALLLANRKVPFALAALMPINLCGLFLSLFIEGNALIGLLAVLTVALNGLLMLAYLPNYRGVVEGGALADGEGPRPGQNYASLFVNPASGAPTVAYLGGTLALLAALAFYWFIVPGLSGLTGMLTLAVPAVLLAVGLARALARRPGS